MDHAKSRWPAPRLLGLAAAIVGTLLLALIAYSGGATAAVGSTDLSIAKTDSPDPVVAGSNLTYTITVTNPGGGNDASNVVVTDNLPSGVDFVSAAGCTHSGNTVTCNLGQVNSGTAPQVTIVVRPKKEGTLTNTATVASPNDAALGNNSATATTTVVKAAGKGNKKGKVSCATPTISGTAGDDVINGTPNADVIVTDGGNDTVNAGGGNDLVCAGSGADFVFGDAGRDTLIGGSGPDRLVGGPNGDLLKGKRGRDRLAGQGGSDTLNGGKNRDRCKGGAGRDTLISCP